MTRVQLIRKAAPVLLAAAMVASGCGRNKQQANNPPQYSGQQAQPQQGAMNPEAAPPPQQASGPQQQPGYAPPPAGSNPPPPPPESTMIPAGTHVVVSLGETLSTRTSQPGERFEATVVAPVVVHGVTLVRAGSRASGTVVDAKSAGRFKGQGLLVIRLDSVRSEGRTYEVRSSTIDRVEQGKGKRTAVLAGGGGGLGALIGGLAGGGKGALIGALAGGGAGTAGAAFTGNHELEIPAETRLTFRIERNVPLT